MILRPLSLALLCLSAAGAPAVAQNSDAAARARFNQPQAPFRIIGNVHYVGTATVAAYLVTGPEGHVLIDGVIEESVPQIAANIRALGFRVEDVRLIVNNHAHWDHAGGLAGMKRLTGAPLAASAADAPDLTRGVTSHRHDLDRFEPVVVDRIVADRDALSVGPIEMTAHMTPGHTPGCTSWSVRAEEAGRSHVVLFACSMTVAGLRLVDSPDYPGAAADFARTFDRLDDMHADVFLDFHPGPSFHARRERAAAGDPLAFVDPAELPRRVAAARAAFAEALVRQQAAEGQGTAQ